MTDHNRTPPGDDTIVPDPMEALVNECVERIEAGESHAADEICSRHPDHATRIRKHLDWLRESGLLDTQSFPERLGEFRLIRRIGGGGMGAVFLAEQEGLGRRVALKIMRPEHQFFPTSHVRFQREVEAIAQLEHPAIVPIYTVGEENGVHYYAMERVNGCTIAELLHGVRGTPSVRLTGRDLLSAMESILQEDADVIAALPAGQFPEILGGSWTDVCLQITSHVADALAHAHRQGIVHRDVKPSNLMLTRDGRVRVLDFGLASSPTSKLTASGARLGSLPYMSPEQLEGTAVDTRADVYALGVTLYEMLTLREPYVGQTTETTAQKIRDGHPAAIRLFNAKVSKDAETVCLKAMEVDARRRYATAEEFRDDLDRVVRCEPILARRPNLGVRLRRWVQRRPATAIAIAAVFLLITGLPTALFLQERSAAETIRRQAKTAEEVCALMIELFQTADREFVDGAIRAPRKVLDDAVVRVNTELTGDPEVRASLMHAIGSVYRNLGFRAEAQKLLEQALDLSADPTSAAEDESVSASCHELLVSLCATRGEFADAEHHARAALKIRRKTSPNGGAALARATAEMGYVLRLLGESDEAESLGRRAVQMHREVGTDKKHLAYALFHLGGTLATNHQEDAVSAMRDALAILENLSDGRPEHSFSTRVQLAHVLHRSGRLDEALAEFDVADRFAQKTLRPGDLRRAHLNSCYAALLKDLTRLAEAEKRVSAAIQMRRRESTPNNPQLADDLSILGMVRYQTGDLAGARQAYGESLKIERTLHAGAHHNLAVRMANLASVTPDGAELAAAAVAMHRELGSRNTAYANSLGVHAGFLISSQRLDEAKTVMDLALKLLREIHPQGHLQTAYALNRSCTIHLIGNECAAALSVAQDALALWRRLVPGDHAGKANALLNLGWAERLDRSAAAAETHLTAAAEMRARAAPEGDGIMAYALMHLGPTQAMQQKFDAAQVTMERCIELTGRLFGEDSPLLMNPRLDLSLLHETKGRLDLAEELAWVVLDAQYENPTPSPRPVVRMLRFLRNQKSDADSVAPLVKLLRITTEIHPRKDKLLGTVAGRLCETSVASGQPGAARLALEKAVLAAAESPGARSVLESHLATLK